MPATPSESTVIFTPIPAGISSGGLLRLSIFTTFRLTKDPSTLGDYPDVVNWAGRDLNFDVTIDGSTFAATADEPHARNLADWQTLFPSSTTVIKRDGVEDHHNGRIRSFSAAGLADTFRRENLRFATKHPAGPPASEVAKRFSFLAYKTPEQRNLALQAVEGAIATAGTTRFSASQLKQSITDVTTTTVRKSMRGKSEVEIAAKISQLTKAISKPLLTDPGRQFMVARAFRDHRYVDANPVKVVPYDAELDFHEMLAAINPHPYLLRRFGIVRDVTIDITDLEAPPSTTLIDVDVAAHWAGSQSTIDSFTVKTMFGPADGVFRAATRQDVLDVMKDGLKSVGGSLTLPRRLKDGYIKLSDPKWELVTCNVEEAALAMEGLAIDLDNYEEPPAAQLDKAGTIAAGLGGGPVINPSEQTSIAALVTPAPTEKIPGRATPKPKLIPPNLRSSGIYLVRDGIEDEVRADMAHMSNLESKRRQNQRVFLCAEDLTRGYAIDINTGGVWKSLCERQGEYTIGASTVEAPHDFVGEAAVIPSFAGLNGGLDDLVMHPALACWSGWSLAAPLPGKVVASTGAYQGQPGQPLIDPPTATLPGFPMRAKYVPKAGSLPRLRFGKDYRMRARAIDIAGNTVPLNEARDDQDVTIGPVRYGRYEPIPPPLVLLRTPKKEAEGVERLVLRSNFDADVDPAEVPERLVAPPRSGWSLAEAHGVFDVGTSIDVDAYRKYADPAYQPSVYRHKEGGSTAALGQRDPVISDTTFSPYHFTYLPDAATRRVKFLGLPGTEEALIWDMYIEAFWPNAYVFAIKLEELAPGDDPAPYEYVEPHVGISRRVLVIKVPKGRAYTVRYSSVPTFPDESALLDDAAASLEPVAVGKFKDQLQKGLVDQYTPSRDLIVVHAVLQPNDAPDYASAFWYRAPGATSALLTGRIMMDRPSTERVHLRAAWTEFHDRAPSGPTTEDAAAIVADTAVGFVNAPTGFAQEYVDLQKPEVATGSPQLRTARHEFDDTKHRTVTYTPVASSRFTEYFPRTFNTVATFAAEISGQSEEFLLETHVEPDTVSVINDIFTSTTYERYVDWDVTVDEDGTSKLLRLEGSGMPVAPGRVRATYRRSRLRVGEPRTMRIASSARPLAPKVAFITPAFSWEPAVEPAVLEGEGSSVTSERFGRKLRVWMERPWFSSGGGEQLGVLLLPSLLTAAQTKAADPYVTQFANDPIFAGSSVKNRYATSKNFQAYVPPFPPPPEEVQPWGVTVGRRDGVTLQELGSSGPRPTVLAYNVAYDHGSKRWYSDISIDMLSKTVYGELDTQYFPFVRLALVRYQKNALTGCHVSQVVRADFVQIAPDRAATVVRTGSNVQVTVVGMSYYNGPQSGNERTRVTAQWQVVAGASPDFEWSNLGSEVELTSAPNALLPPRLSWTGSLAVPFAGQQRLVIREYERYEGIAAIMDGESSGPTQERLVYMDVITVS